MWLTILRQVQQMFHLPCPSLHSKKERIKQEIHWKGMIDKLIVIYLFLVSIATALLITFGLFKVCE